MSIYATGFSIENLKEEQEKLEKEGVSFTVLDENGVIALEEDFIKSNPDYFDAPIVYKGSHVLPQDSDTRGGSLE